MYRLSLIVWESASSSKYLPLWGWPFASDNATSIDRLRDIKWYCKRLSQASRRSIYFYGAFNSGVNWAVGLSALEQNLNRYRSTRELTVLKVCPPARLRLHIVRPRLDRWIIPSLAHNWNNSYLLEDRFVLCQRNHLKLNIKFVRKPPCRLLRPGQCEFLYGDLSGQSSSGGSDGSTIPNMSNWLFSYTITWWVHEKSFSLAVEWNTRTRTDRHSFCKMPTWRNRWMTAVHTNDRIGKVINSYQFLQNDWEETNS